MPLLLPPLFPKGLNTAPISFAVPVIAPPTVEPTPPSVLPTEAKGSFIPWGWFAGGFPNLAASMTFSPILFAVPVIAPPTVEPTEAKGSFIPCCCG